MGCCLEMSALPKHILEMQRPCLKLAKNLQMDLQFYWFWFTCMLNFEKWWLGSTWNLYRFWAEVNANNYLIVKWQGSNSNCFRVTGRFTKQRRPLWYGDIWAELRNKWRHGISIAGEQATSAKPLRLECVQHVWEQGASMSEAEWERLW